MKVAAIIQARMASTRLPGKVLLPVGESPMLDLVLARAQRAATIDHVILATSDQPSDDAIEEHCAALGVTCFRGSQNDVLDRFHRAALAHPADVIVRLTADCPLLDPDVIDLVVRAFDPAKHEYVSNTIERTYPDGLDTEVFSLAALERAWREATLASEREHVTPYIWKHPEIFRMAQVTQSRDFSKMRWTVDEPRDLELVREVCRRLGPQPFGMPEIIALLAREPSLAELNAGIDCNEGYDLSVRNDREVAPPQDGQ